MYLLVLITIIILIIVSYLELSSSCYTQSGDSTIIKKKLVGIDHIVADHSVLVPTDYKTMDDRVDWYLHLIIFRHYDIPRSKN